MSPQPTPSAHFASSLGTTGSGSTLGESGTLSGAAGLTAISGFENAFGSKSFQAGAKIFGKTVDQVGKTVKNKEGMKNTGKMFAKLASAAASFGLSMFIYLLEQMGILAPFFKVFGGLLKYLGGKILVALMPIIERFITVLTSEEFLAMLTAIAEVIAVMLTPALELMLMLLSGMQEAFPELSIELMLLAEEIGELISIILEEEEILTAVIVLVKIMVFFLRMFVFEIRIIIAAVTSMVEAMKAWKKWIVDIEKAINSATGGSSAGSRSRSGSHGDVADAVLGAIGLAEGTDYVPATGMYMLHEGEGVSTAEENTNNNYQTYLQEENNALLKDLLHHMKYEV